MKKLLVVLAAGVLGVAGCGGSPGGSTQTADLDEFCAASRQLLTLRDAVQEVPVDSPQFIPTFRAMSDALADVAESAPDEIRAPIDTLAESYAAGSAAARTGKPTPALARKRGVEMITPAYNEAREMARYIAANCKQKEAGDEDEDATTSVNTAYVRRGTADLQRQIDAAIRSSDSNAECSLRIEAMQQQISRRLDELDNPQTMQQHNEAAIASSVVPRLTRPGLCRRNR